MLKSQAMIDLGKMKLRHRSNFIKSVIKLLSKMSEILNGSAKPTICLDGKYAAMIYPKLNHWIWLSQFGITTISHILCFHLAYLYAAKTLATHPSWYNTLLDNCTTAIFNLINPIRTRPMTIASYYRVVCLNIYTKLV